jgi:hypothetical protein
MPCDVYILLGETNKQKATLGFLRKEKEGWYGKKYMGL